MIDFSKASEARVRKYVPSWRERIDHAVRGFFYRFRIDLCFDESDGFDVGAFVYDWKRARGPFMFHRQSGDHSSAEAGPWRLMIAFTGKAYDGFDEGASK